MDWGLGLCALTAEGVDSIPGLGARIPQAMRRRQKQKKKKDSRKMGAEGMNNRQFIEHEKNL